MASNVFEKYYVYIVLLAAALLMIIPPILNIWESDVAIYRGIVLLVVASPCALVASVVPVMLAAMSHATKQGVLIKGSVAIQQLSNVKTIFYDKTGTITYGMPQIENIEILGGDKQEVFKHIYQIEKQSNHPIGKAITSYISEQIDTVVDDVSTKELKGMGIEASNVNG